jgi:hypothetical protein
MVLSASHVKKRLTHTIFIHFLDFGDPEQCRQLPGCLPGCKLDRIVNEIPYVEHTRLNQNLELSANQRPGILEDVSSANGGDREAHSISRLQARYIYFFRISRQLGVRNMPDVFCYSQ